MKKSGNDNKPSIDKIIVEAGEESFPASDPVAWTLGTDAVPMADSQQHDLVQMISVEHRLIRQALNRVEIIIKTLQDQQKISADKIQMLYDFFDLFVAKYHHPHEEALFPFLKAGREHLSEYLLTDLHQEHQYSDHILSEIKKQHDNNQLIKLLKDLHDLHLNHTAKEDEYILPVINKLIDPNQQKSLLEKFMKEKENISPENNTKMYQFVE